jgi:hypothetical protein
MSGILATILGRIAYFLGRYLGYGFASYLDVYGFRWRGASKPPGEFGFSFRMFLGCVALLIVGIPFAVGAVIGNFWSWGWHLAPGWGLPLGMATSLLFALLPNRWIVDSLIIVVAALIGLLMASEGG